MSNTPTSSAQVAEGMNQYRKKPVVIEAIQWPGNKFATTPPKWFIDAMHAEPGSVGFVMRWDNDILIDTLEGRVRASPGDWIIRGIKGEIYPCRDDIFAATYEAAAQVAEGVALPPLDAEGLPPLSEVRIVKLAEAWAMTSHAYISTPLNHCLDYARAIESEVIAPYAERIRQLERELKQAKLQELSDIGQDIESELAETKANLQTAVQEAWKANAELSEAKRELATFKGEQK